MADTALVDQEMGAGLGHVQGNLPYEQLENKSPYLCGSFTGWRYKKMIPLHEFNQMIDTDYKSPWDQCKQDGLIQKFKVPTDELSERD